MKSNLVFGLLATLMLASCSQDDVIQEMDTSQSAIGFTTFVDKASRAETTTTDNLETFKVWATKFREGNTDAVRIMNGVDVTRSGDEWIYSPKKYWVNENAYSFTAIGSSKPNISKYYTYKAPAVEDISYDTYHTHYMGTLEFDNSANGANGSADLIWASTKVETIPEDGVGPSTVNFTFGHLLSRVNLKFVNSRTIENPAVKIKNISVESAANGTIDFSKYHVSTPSTDFKWSYSTDKAKCQFNFPSSNPLGISEYTLNKEDEVTTLNQFLIPSQNTIRVSFDCYTSITAEDGEDAHINISKDIKFGSEGSPAPFVNVDLKPGYSYTLVAYLTDNLDNSGSINISVEVSEYIENSAPAYAVNFNNPVQFDTNDGGQDNTLSQTISVKQITVSDELVYYGSRAGQTDLTNYGDFTFKWTIPSNVNYSFDSESGLKGKPVSEKTMASVSSINDLRVDLYVIGNYSPDGSTSTNSGNIPVTLTMMDKEGKKVYSETLNVPVKFTKTISGGSMDGDDNDG